MFGQLWFFVFYSKLPSGPKILFPYVLAIGFSHCDVCPRKVALAVLGGSFNPCAPAVPTVPSWLAPAAAERILLAAPTLVTAGLAAVAGLAAGGGGGGGGMTGIVGAFGIKKPISTPFSG